MRACTIVARNHLAKARVLARSFLEHHPGSPFTILVVDELRDAPKNLTGEIELLSLDDIGLDPGDAHRMPMIYSVTELSTAVKPWLLRWMLNSGPGPVVYFDPDIEIFAPLDDIAWLAQKHGIVLTPRVTEPMPRDRLRLSESDILGAGIYNLGFLAIGPGSEPFLDWWSVRLRRESVVDPTRMRFTDQRWIDFVPGLYCHYILRDPTCNVAYWNLYSRKVVWTGSHYEVNGKPLRFFHYSGFDPDKPHLLSKHQGDQSRIIISEQPGIARICQEYSEKLQAEGFNETRHHPYRFDSLSNGVSLDGYIHNLYRTALIKFEEGDAPEPPSPFGTEGEEAFVKWLNESMRDSPPIVSRYMLAIHAARLDLQSAFPEPLGKHAAAFHKWFLTYGCSEVHAHKSLVPPDGGVSSNGSTQPVSPGDLIAPANVVGYLRAELGVGEAARSLTAGLGASNLHQAHYQNGKLHPQTELDAEQIEALERARAKSSAQIEQIDGKVVRLSAVVDLQRSSMMGLRQCSARLEQRLENVSARVRGAGQALVKGDPEMPAMADLISEDIRRIHDPSFLWRMAKALGLLGLAHAGVPRTAEERRALARELKAGLREICQVLSSPATTPEEIAAEIPRLFQLRRQTRELLQSLKLSSLILRRSHIWNIVHWARRAPSSLPALNPAAALFDAAWYLGQYQDVAASETDPLTHYLRWGAREGRNPNPILDSAWYLSQNADVAAAGINPMEHYWHFGAIEGRNPSPLFDTKWYAGENPDVAASGINPLEHYLAHGVKECRAPHPLFHQAWYLAQNPEVAGLNPLQHYLQWGRSHGLSPHPLFDPFWYLARNSDVAAAGNDPFQHYLASGAAEGRDPHPLFDSKWYLAQGKNLNTGGLTPLQHYLLIGAKERRSPHPKFDAPWYAENFPETRECADLLTHYLTIGWHRGYKPSPYFDPQAYLQARPDVARSGIEPLTHFVVHGRMN